MKRASVAQKAEEEKNEPHIPMGPRRDENQSQYDEHESRSSIPRSLESADEHLKNQNVRSQKPLRAGHPTINFVLVRRAVLDWVEERVIVAVNKNDSSTYLNSAKTRNLSLL